MNYLRRVAYPLLMIVALFVLLIEIPVGEIRRAWRNLRVVSEVRRALWVWANYWREWP